MGWAKKMMDYFWQCQFVDKQKTVYLQNKLQTMVKAAPLPSIFFPIFSQTSLTSIDSSTKIA